MIYTWKCAECAQLTECTRKLVDIDIPPEKCEHCPSKQFAHSVIVRPQGPVKGFILLGDSGWHHTDYSRYRSVK